MQHEDLSSTAQVHLANKSKLQVYLAVRLMQVPYLACKSPTSHVQVVGAGGRFGAEVVPEVARWR
eukprot:926471-Pelagomonas_calceolata.AAC.1